MVCFEIAPEYRGKGVAAALLNRVISDAKAEGYDIPFLLYDGHVLPFEDESIEAVIIWAQTFGLLYGDI